MTLKQANVIFTKKYPNGEIFSHNFGAGYSDNTMKNKVALVFEKGKKVYIYNGSYEKVLSKLGFTIPKTEKQLECEKQIENFDKSLFDFDFE